MYWHAIMHTAIPREVLGAGSGLLIQHADTTGEGNQQKVREIERHVALSHAQNETIT